MLNKLMAFLLGLIMKFLVNEKNIKKVFELLIGLLEKYAKKSSNDFDNKLVEELKKALSL